MINKTNTNITVVIVILRSIFLNTLIASTKIPAGPVK